MGVRNYKAQRTFQKHRSINVILGENASYPYFYNPSLFSNEMLRSGHESYLKYLKLIVDISFIANLSFFFSLFLSFSFFALTFFIVLLSKVKKKIQTNVLLVVLNSWTEI